MKIEFKHIEIAAYTVLAIILIVGYFRSRKINKRHTNTGDDLAKWHGLTDKDFNKN